jgi:predicted amidohydrolase
MTLTVACIQLNSGDDIKANIAKIETLVAKAAKTGAEFVVLPENAFFMGDPAAKTRQLFTQDTHPGVKAAKNMAVRHALWLLAGSVAVLPKGKGTKTVNRSLLFNPQGELTASYDKIHLFDVQLPNGEVYAESAKFLPGKKSMLSKAPLGKLGLTVCYDLRFPHLYRALAKKGADIIAVPSAFTQTTGEAHWHVLLRARAIENGCFIIAPAQTGTHPGGRKTYGHSLIVDPWGKVLADGGTKEGVVLAEIDLAQVKKIRASLPSLKHDRKF